MSENPVIYTTQEHWLPATRNSGLRGKRVMRSGVCFDLLDPQPETVRLDDIAHHLSLLCRFCGGTPELYTVAQHSIIVSRMCPLEIALAGLLHDAHEAFVGDIPAPLKDLLGSELGDIEAKIQGAIHKRFGVREKLSSGDLAAIKEADTVAYEWERDSFFGHAGWTGARETELGSRIIPMTQAESHDRFLALFYLYGGAA